MRTRRRRLGTASVLAVAALLASVPVAMQSPASAVSAQAATAVTAAPSASEFSAGNIISDDRFFDANAMSEAQVQAFLEQAVPNCRATDPNVPCLRNFVGMTNTKASSGARHCTGYNSEGWESAARIIWRVGQACGISPQVLLVTLQKEQTLVTSTAPMERQYRVAMGYACPDTGSCDTQYYGFFNQVYSAAWQFRQYTNFPDRRYRIGPVSIQYHPNASCGASTVDIQNQATANLYNYTPYQPNAAALANLGGSGDSCSAYGNRNFWYTFYNWFGSPTSPGVSPIDAMYQSQGGATGPLGRPVGGLIWIPENGGGSAQVYENASIYWTARTGAWYVWKDIREHYWALAGAAGRLGWPMTNPLAIAAAQQGEGQVFETGSIYRSANGVFAVEGAIRQRYWALAGPESALGWPIADRTVVAPGFVQQFQGGRIVAGPPGTFVLTGPIAAWYGTVDGPNGAAGWPLSDTIGIPENGGGFGQMFAGGSVYSSAAGTFLVSGPLRDAYWARGGSAGSLGWPTAAASCSAGTCSQAFQNGALVVGGDGSVRVAWPPIEAFYESMGGAGGALGARWSEAIRIPENGGGFGQMFAGGSVYSSAAGTFLVSGPLRDAYWARGGSAGSLGWPTAAASCSTGTCSQAFQNGALVVGGDGSVRVAWPPIEAFYESMGGAGGALGARWSEAIRIPENGGGFGQMFAGGSVYSSAAGTVLVSGPLRDAYWARGGSAGSLGWPTAAASCSAGTCSQAFQNGSLTAPAS